MVIRYLVTILLSLTLVGCGIEQRFLTALREKANRFSENKEYDKEANVREVVLKIAKWSYGPDHINVAVSLYDLGKAYMAQGKYTEAELSCRRALEIFKLNSAVDHPDAGTIRILLAGIYRRQGKFAQATFILLKTLKIEEKIHGPNHRGLIIPNINVAWLYRDEGNYAKMEFFFQRALAILELREKREIPVFEKAIEIEIESVMHFYRDTGNKVMENKFKMHLGNLQSSNISPGTGK